MNLETICKIANIDRFGAFDYAVPMEWLMRDPERNRPHFWYYPSAKGKPGRSFGRPLKWMAVARLALRVMRQQGIPELDQWLRMWAYVHPAKGLDQDGIEAVKRFLDNSNDSMRFHIGSIISRFDIPAPPEGTFDSPTVRQAA